jgi:hypothetical protein
MILGGEEVRGMAGKYRGPRIKVCFGGKVYLNVGRLAESVGEDPEWFRKGRGEGRKREFELQGHRTMRGTVWDEYVGLKDWYKCINL